jgi:hypothetical protein
LDRLAYPVKIDSLEEVEHQLGIAFNVFPLFDDEGKERYPLYLCRLNVDNAIDLLYWNTHFPWIKNFECFMSDLPKHQGQLHWRKRSVYHFRLQNVCDTHKNGVAVWRARSHPQGAAPMEKGCVQARSVRRTRTVRHFR